MVDGGEMMGGEVGAGWMCAWRDWMQRPFADTETLRCGLIEFEWIAAMMLVGGGRRCLGVVVWMVEAAQRHWYGARHRGVGPAVGSRRSIWRIRSSLTSEFCCVLFLRPLVISILVFHIL